MTTNPVYRREITVSARSIRLPLIIAAVNFITAAVAITGMWRAVENAAGSAGIDITVFPVLFRYLAIVEFLLMLFIMPALTAGSISGEKERGTLDLMLTTRLTPAGIVAGKMMSALSGMFIVILSGLPIMMLAFIYGGASAGDVVLLAVCLLASAFLSAAAGVFASAAFRKTAAAAAVAYGIVFGLTVGTAALAYFRYRYAGPARGLGILLAVNPFSAFFTVIGRMTGIRDTMSVIRIFTGISGPYGETLWTAAGIGLQIVLGIGLCLWSVSMIRPAKGR